MCVGGGGGGGGGGKRHASLCLFTVQIRPRGYKTFFYDHLN